ARSCSFTCLADARDLRSFPTRRSSDLPRLTSHGRSGGTRFGCWCRCTCSTWGCIRLRASHWRNGGGFRSPGSRGSCLGYQGWTAWRDRRAATGGRDSRRTRCSGTSTDWLFRRGRHLARRLRLLSPAPNDDTGTSACRANLLFDDLVITATEVALRTLYLICA